MKSKKISAFTVLGDKPLILSLDNPTKSDTREFIKAIYSLLNDKLETVSRFSLKATVVEEILTTVEVE
jgi:hypothetical protein